MIREDPKQRRAEAARRAFKSPRPPLRSFTKELGQRKTPRSHINFEGSCRFFGASPVASVLGIRSGATPYGRFQPNMPFAAQALKGDISTWQRRGHF